MASFRSRFPLGIVVAALLAGCAGGDRPELGYVTGTVYMDDKPLPNVWVMFSPTTGRTSMGHTNESGEYELMYLEGTKGANLGTHTVRILTYNEDEVEEMKLNTGQPVKEPILPKYNTQTTLTEDVKEGDQVIDFKLESK